MRLGIDVMGGDHAPDAVLKGCVDALEHLDAGDRLVLVGPSPLIEDFLRERRVSDGRLVIEHAPDLIEMGESAARGVRSKPDSSIVRLAWLGSHKAPEDRRCDVVMSAGNTGACVSAAIMQMKRLPHVHRPGIAVTIPAFNGPVVLTDAGANPEPKAEHLWQYALMADEYARHVLRIDRPRVAQMNIGSEESKGTELVQPSAGASSASKPAATQAAGSTSIAGASPSASAVMEPPAVNGAPSGEPRGRIFASPLARKIAAESGVDLAGVEGTGPGGRIVRKDVEAAMAGGAPASKLTDPSTRPAAAPLLPMAGATLAARRVPLSNMRRTIATRLVQSKQTIPHYQVTVEVDMDALLDLRKQLNEQLAAQGVKLSVNDFIVRACALAMHQHPFVNARWSELGAEVAIDCLPDVNIGVAIALDESKGGGLVVATLRQADRKGLRQLSAETKALSDKARSKGLSVEEMSDSTFTISNLGMFGVDHFTAIINPPNAAILAVGAAIQKPVARNGQLAIGHVMSMTMSSDHRIIDGAMAASYLATVKGMLERPATLLV
ncbi:2-oxo acid dehydrogenase subunit E2 [Leptolyngbya sp. 15MV]|nr:2-oxo acid dehydrogenase subunit E2 [Leptolyngbya sp. 15MV]